MAASEREDEYNGQTLAPPSASHKMPDRLAVDVVSVKRAVRLTMYGFICLGALVVFVNLIVFACRPPSLANASNWTLARTSERVRSALRDGEGVLVGKQLGVSYELRVYPLSGGKSVLIDTPDSFAGVFAFISPYEPAFDYLRGSRIKPTIGERLGALYEQLSSGTFSFDMNANGYLPYAAYTYDRLMVRLDDFGISSASDIGLSAEPSDPEGTSIVVPQPEGWIVFLYNGRFPVQIRSKKDGGPPSIELSASFADDKYGFLPPKQPSRIELNIPALRNPSGEPGTLYVAPLQGGTHGVYFSYYVFGSGEYIGVIQSGIVLCELKNELQSTILADIQPGKGGPPLWQVQRFRSSYYIEKKNAVLGTVTSVWKDGYGRYISLYDPAQNVLVPLYKIYGEYSECLADYDNGCLFFFAGAKPEKAESYPGLSNDYTKALNLPNATAGTEYYLCRLDTATLDLTTIASCKSSKYVSEYGGEAYGSPALTLSEASRQVIYADRDELVAIDYDGKNRIVLDTDPKATWRMLYSVNRQSQS